MFKLASLLFVVVLLSTPLVCWAQYDELGNYTGSDPGPDPGEIGLEPESCGDCKDPASGTWGVAFRDDEMWVATIRRKLFRLSDCEPVLEISLTGMVLPAGLGYDSSRDLFFVTDASFNELFQLAPSGRILARWPTPGPGPIGAAYDSRRDLYWVSDWEEDRIYAIDPTTGLPGPDIAIPAGSRISGLAYDADLDALIYHSRDDALTFWISVETNAVLAAVEIPFSGKNNGAGAGLDSSQRTLWLSHNDDPRIFCERGLRPATGSGRRRSRPGLQFQALAPSSDALDERPSLLAPSPNPFNPTTEIRFVMPQPGRAVVSVYDARGMLVATLLDGVRPAGSHTVRWSAPDSPSGVYFCRLSVGDFSETRKIVLLK